MSYRLRYDKEDRCWRIQQKRLGMITFDTLGWMRFASPEAAHDYVRFHGLPPLFKAVRYWRKVPVS